MAQHQQINRVIELGVAQVGINARDLGHALAALAQENARKRVVDTTEISVAAAVADGGIVGDGTVTLGTPAYGAGVKPGTYTLTCITVAANGGTFELTDPLGNDLGDVTVGTLFDGELRLTVNDGANDFALNDVFTIDVTVGAEAYLTDNSGATPGSALAAVTTATVAEVDNVAAMAPKTGFDAAIGKIEDAHAEIGASLNTLIEAIAGRTYPDTAPYTLAAAADQTIAALDLTLTGTTVDTEGVDATTGNAQIVTARNNQASLCSALNFCRVGLGLAPIADGSGGIFTKSAGSDWPSTAAAATGTGTSAGDDSLTDATVDAALTALGNNIATLAAKFNECLTAIDIGPFVVATNNPGFKFVPGDVVP